MSNSMCVCSELSEPRSSAFESYKKPSSQSTSQTDLDQFPRFVSQRIMLLSFVVSLQQSSYIQESVNTGCG